MEWDRWESRLQGKMLRSAVDMKLMACLDGDQLPHHLRGTERSQPLAHSQHQCHQGEEKRSMYSCKVFIRNTEKG